MSAYANAEAALQDPSVRGPHSDGSYTIVCPPDYGGNWTIRDIGHGWEPTHPEDGFEGDTFATVGDAALAVLGDPALAQRWSR